MPRPCLAVIFMIFVTFSVLRITLPSAAAAPAQVDASKAATSAAQAPRSVDEARGRARLLHETVHATLHYVHHAYFREDEGLKIPAATLEDVFKELESAHKVRLRWLAVNARAMDQCIEMLISADGALDTLRMAC